MPRKIYNLERDIRSTDWLVKKVRDQTVYAQNFYAALCNNTFVPKDTWGILANITWDCSWRYAAIMIADIREREDYLVWYCSGTTFKIQDFAGFVEESFVTEEVANDIDSIGWLLTTKKYLDL